MRFMKALVLPLALVTGTALTGASVAAAAGFTLADVNLKIQQLVAPFNKNTTAMALAFTALNIDANRTLDFGVAGFVSKVGADNAVKAEFKKAQYTYGDGTKPTVELDVDLALNLVTAIGQATMNEFAKDLDQIAVDYAKDLAKDYGPAITVDAKIEDKSFDAKGDVDRIKVKLSAAMDMTKLPVTKPIADVEFQNIDVVLVVTRAGVGLQATFVANPLYKMFADDQNGLKEYVELLLVNDKETWDQFGRFAANLDSMAEFLVTMKP